MGQPILTFMAEDLAAVRAARRALGDDAALMVDFNQSLTVPEAIRRGRALDAEGVAWIEEPVRSDDYGGAAEVAAQVGLPSRADPRRAPPPRRRHHRGAGAPGNRPAMERGCGEPLPRRLKVEVYFVPAA